jgi:hypothetical protein
MKPATVGERDHHRQVVGHDVMHLTSDPRALVRSGQPLPLPALALELRGAVLERGRVGATRAHIEPEDHRCRSHAGEKHERRDHRLSRPAGDGEHDAELQDHAGRDHPAARLVYRDRVDRHQQRAVRRHPDVVDPVRERHGGDHAEDRERRQPPPCQRDDERGGVQPPRARWRARHGEGEEDQREEQVGGEGMAVESGHTSRRTSRMAAAPSVTTT